MKLILGSKSPRRKELLSSIGMQFEIRTKETDENYPETLPIEQVAEYIAQLKADDLIEDLKDDEILLCADTTVQIDNILLGKPKDATEASKMLSLLSGRTHVVTTGVVIASNEMELSFSVKTEVTFKPLSMDEIEYYIETYQPFDKAGSYGIQEWIGYIGIQKINGSYNNVVGLPTHEVYQALQKFE
jgi:septum formation protein